MKKNLTGNRPLERRLLIAQLIQQKLEMGINADSIILTLAELKKHLILTDIHTLEITLERIRKDVGQDFYYKLLGRSGISSAADHENKNPNKIIDSVRIDIEDRPSFSLYVDNIKKESKQIENSYTFIIDDDGNLTRDGDNGKYVMDKESLRYKLVYRLGKEKTFVSAAKLAQKLKVPNPARIRKTVDQIRAMIKKKLHVSGHMLIHSDDSAGYRINNLIIK